MYPGIAVVSLWCVGGRGGERGKGEFREREEKERKEMRNIEFTGKVIRKKKYKEGKGM